jgi:hypothetical protein
MNDTAEKIYADAQLEILTRIAVALERIAAVLEPAKRGKNDTIFDSLNRIAAHMPGDQNMPLKLKKFAGGWMSPRFYCDHCGDQIENAREANEQNT